MDKQSKDFLIAYLNNASPTGFEASGQQLWLSYIQPFIDEQLTDTYGTAVGILHPGAAYRVVIEAHADEIGWFVNYISPEGYLYVVRNGGSDHQIAPSMRVRIQGTKGIVTGVFGWPAIHVRERSNEESPTMKNLFVDVGADSKKEVEQMGIHVGSVMTFEDQCVELNKRYMVGRGLDNRMGGFMIAEVLKRLKARKQTLPYTLYVVNAVQEEIGLRGAEMIAQRLKPHVAFITDVCHDTQSPLYNKKTQGDQQCGKGPVISYGAAVHGKVAEYVEAAAQKKRIPYQRMAASRSTGTDTDAFAYSNEGVPSALVSLPLKYMHTTVEMAHLHDIEQLIELLYHSLVQLPKNKSFAYL